MSITMSDVTLDHSKSGDDRRAQARTRIEGLLQLVDLGPENGGLMLDLSEGGLAVQAVYPVVPQTEIPVNFLLPNTDIRIDAKAHVAWGGHSKQVGLRFTDVPDGARQQIRDWLNSAPQFEDVFTQPLPDSLHVHSDLPPFDDPVLAALQSSMQGSEFEALPEVRHIEEPNSASFFSFPVKSDQNAPSSQTLSGVVGRVQLAQMTESLAHLWRWPGFVDRLKSLSPAARQHLLYELDFQARALSLWLLEIEKGQPAKAEAEASPASAVIEPSRSSLKSRSS